MIEEAEPYLKSSGRKKADVAKQIGISRQLLDYYLNNSHLYVYHEDGELLEAWLEPPVNVIWRKRQ